MRALEGPLAQLVGDELTRAFSRMLSLAYRKGAISYQKLKGEIPSADELLFGAYPDDAPSLVSIC